MVHTSSRPAEADLPDALAPHARPLSSPADEDALLDFIAQGRLVLDSLGVTRDEVGFVTSNYFDVAGAKAFGFKVFWINRGGAVPDELDLLPDVELDSLAGLPAA